MTIKSAAAIYVQLRFAIMDGAFANSLHGGTNMTKKRKHREDQPLQTICYCRLCGIGEFAGTLNKNDDRYMVHDNVVYEKISPEKIRIDTDSIPKPVRENLAAATLDFVRRMMQEPGTREKIEARIQSKKDPQQK